MFTISMFIGMIILACLFGVVIYVISGEAKKFAKGLNKRSQIENYRKVEKH